MTDRGPSTEYRIINVWSIGRYALKRGADTSDPAQRASLYASALSVMTEELRRIVPEIHAMEDDLK